MLFFTEILLIVIAGYFFIAFFLSRLIIPFMGFTQYQPPKGLPEEVRQKISELENASKEQSEYLKKAYDFVQSRWHSERLNTILKFHLIFRTDLTEFWHSPGYAHCTNVNFVLYVLLTGSRFFKADDIRFKHVFFNAVPHQYLRVNVGGNWLDIDPSLTYVRGVPFGQRTKKWFG